MLRLAAKPVTDGQRQHGNGIMYGGGTSPMLSFDDYQQRELFYVETDFGNKMKLTWTELTTMFDIVSVVDYKVWRAERAELIQQDDMDSLIERGFAPK